MITKKDDGTYVVEIPARTLEEVVEYQLALVKAIDSLPGPDKQENVQVYIDLIKHFTLEPWHIEQHIEPLKQITT